MRRFRAGKARPESGLANSMLEIGTVVALALGGWSAPGAGDLEAGVVELRGRVVCVDASGAVGPCAEANRRFALRTIEGGLHRFLESDSLAGMFGDERVRERELLVRARPAPSGRIETVKVYSVREGLRYDLDYFCEVCNVTAYAPGPCPCCRQIMVLRERPLR